MDAKYLFHYMLAYKLFYFSSHLPFYYLNKCHSWKPLGNFIRRAKYFFAFMLISEQLQVANNFYPRNTLPHKQPFTMWGYGIYRTCIIWYKIITLYTCNLCILPPMQRFSVSNLFFFRHYKYTYKAIKSLWIFWEPSLEKENKNLR